MTECARRIDDTRSGIRQGWCTVMEYLLGPVQKLVSHEAGIER
jgi:hypothetical protein